MKGLLTSRKKLEFWAKNKTYLTHVIREDIEEYDITIYREEKAGYKTLGIWVAYKGNDQIQLSKISTEIDTYHYQYGSEWAYFINESQDEIYLFGNAGIFYKRKDSALEKIFSDNKIGALIFYANIFKIIIIKRYDREGIIANVENGKITPMISEQSITEIDENSSWYYQDKITRMNTYMKKGTLEIWCIDSLKRYIHHILTKEGLQTSEYTFFEKPDRAPKKPILAFNSKSQEKVLVTKSGNEISSFGRCQKIEHITSDYYLATGYKSADEIHILEYVSKDEIRDLEKIGNNVKSIKVMYKMFDVTFLEVIYPEGIELLAMFKGGVKKKFYPDAIDIEVSESELRKVDDTLEIMPSILIKKVVNFD